MAEQVSIDSAAVTALLNRYQPPDLAYDELGHGSIPHHWSQILDHFAGTMTAEGAPQPEHLRSEMLVRDLDIARPTRLDALPFAVSDEDWSLLQSGLEQRATLLNAITADLYGPRTLLSPEGLPPALIFGNPRYLLPVCDAYPHGNEFLQLVAFDVGRSPDGQWRVLADWTEAPAGLGMCLENRVLAGQTLPELFQQADTQRLAQFFRTQARHLSNIAASTVNDGITVMLSPGPTHPYYFEHAYLGQYFGFPVVESADLSVRGGELFLKTLEGLKPVGCVVRFTPADRCDPLYLDTSSRDGVTGLVQVARQGNVHIANALGSAIVESDALMSFLPGLSQRLLGQDLMLPSLATWWCGQPQENAYVQANRDFLSIAPAFSRPELFAADISAFQSAASTVHPDLASHESVGRELIQLSHAPYLDPTGHVAAGPVVLRLFVAMTDDGYRLMPGGIARIATPDGELSKDLWVNRQAARELPPLPEAATAQARRSDRDLPSRTADDLFWLGRYLERCEGAVRTYRCLFSHVAEGASDDQQQILHTVTQLLVDLDLLSNVQARRLADPSSAPLLASQWWAMLFDSSKQESLDGLLQHIHRLANQVRERLSGDAWRMFNHLMLTPQQQHWRLTNVSDALQLMDQLIRRLSGLNGQIQENMTRGYGWRMLELGRRLERAQFALQVMGGLVPNEHAITYLYSLLDLSDSAITYRSRYQTTPVLENLLDLLLLDNTNPRSVLYQIQRLQEVMSEMPLEQNAENMSAAQRLLLVAHHELLLADTDKLANVISRAGNRTQLRRVLQRLDESLTGLSELVTATYFAHTHQSSQMQ